MYICIYKYEKQKTLRQASKYFRYYCRKKKLQTYMYVHIPMIDPIIQFFDIDFFYD